MFFSAGKEQDDEKKSDKETENIPPQDEIEKGDVAQEREDNETRDNLTEVNLRRDLLLSRLPDRSDHFDLSSDESLLNSEDNVSILSFQQQPIINQDEENISRLRVSDDGSSSSLLSLLLSSESGEETQLNFFYTNN